MNYGNYAGQNIISLSYDIKQVIYILNLIKNKTTILESNNEFKMFSGFNFESDIRNIYMSIIPDYNVNNSINNINLELNDIEYIIIEVVN